MGKGKGKRKKGKGKRKEEKGKGKLAAPLNKMRGCIGSFGFAATLPEPVWPLSAGPLFCSEPTFASVEPVPQVCSRMPHHGTNCPDSGVGMT